MKTNVLLLLCMVFLALSCSRDDLFTKGQNDPDPDNALLKKGGNAGAVIRVSPNGTDDTQNLIDAFALAKASGAGSTVQLAEGEYHIGFVLVEDFIGAFTGAGMGKSIIVPLPNLPNNDLYAQNLAPVLVKFLRGNVRISNMSFLNLEGEPSPGDDLWGFLGLFDWAHTELPDLPENHKIMAVVDHVEFVSNPGPAGWTPYAVQTGIAGGSDFVWDSNLPYSNTDITVTNCTFKELNWAITNLAIEKGKIVICNNGPINTNGGIWLADDIGGSTLISGNEFYTPAWGSSLTITDANYTAAGLNEFKLSDGCQYEISGNIFHATDAWGAITIANDRKALGIIDNKNPVLALIKNNLFDLQGSVYAGIWNWITDDAVIRNNKFTGQAMAGLYVDPRVENSLMLGNNFSNLVCTDHNIVLLGNNSTVIGGGNNSTSVLNLGENNVITGAKFDNEGQNPMGQTIVDNYKIWKENLVKMRKR